MISKSDCVTGRSQHANEAIKQLQVITRFNKTQSLCFAASVIEHTPIRIGVVGFFGKTPTFFLQHAEPMCEW